LGGPGAIDVCWWARCAIDRHDGTIAAAAAAGEATPWLLATIAQDPIFCAGYRPFCVGQDGFSLGAYLTAFCRDQAPFIDDALYAAVDGDPSTRPCSFTAPTAECVKCRTSRPPTRP
jgi:hypothetical protein